MASSSYWSELLDGCKVLAALAVNEQDPTKQAARVEARKAVRTAITSHLINVSEIHFSQEAANEIITTVARTFLQQRQGNEPAMAIPLAVTDEMLGL